MYLSTSASPRSSRRRPGCWPGTGGCACTRSFPTSPSTSASLTRADLARLRAQLREGDALLLGTDLVKDPAVLVAAYDDAAGLTAEFNKNILRVLNGELDGNFDLDEFDHVAIWNAQNEWIEMRLRSAIDQTVLLRAMDLSVQFAAG